jgi:hypothetical protein
MRRLTAQSRHDFDDDGLHHHDLQGSLAPGHALWVIYRSGGYRDEVRGDIGRSPMR